MGCKQSKEKKHQPDQADDTDKGSVTSIGVPAAAPPSKPHENSALVQADKPPQDPTTKEAAKEPTAASAKSPNSSCGSNSGISAGINNIQVAGHQNLRLGQDGKFLIKPVSRDALVIHHLIESAEVAGLPKTLHFLRPFVADFSEALYIKPLTSTSTSERNGLKILENFRKALAGGEERLTFEEYFNRCRRRLEAAEETLAVEAEDVEEGDINNKSEASPVGEVDGKHVKKSKSSVKKPWELIMANACAGLTAPCVVDVKLGKYRTTPGAPNADIKEAKDDGTTTRLNGVRMTGLHYIARGPDGHPIAPPISKSLPEGWDRKTITTDEKLANVIDSFLGACCVYDVCAVEQKKEVSHDKLAAAVFIGDDESLKAAEADGLHFRIQKQPALAKELHRQLGALVKALYDEGQLITSEFGFLSTSVLLVYDAVAWYNDGSVVLPPNPAEVAKVLLIDFDRSGPRSEHHSEDKVQFLSAIAALDGYLERAEGDITSAQVSEQHLQS